ncbi:hypothetical protein KAR91_40150 [Candidatus Pacearchaeota archaeon]|nr:hypothetical protein [Candidatus Pacearchaeota archaeon]
MLKKYKKYKKPLQLLAVLVVAGQFLFLISSGSYTQPKYEGKFFATTGVKFDGVDLHKLNEGAHYFGQTMIGWTRFPHFREDLIKSAELAEDTEITMYMQERQNIIFTLGSSEPVEQEAIESAHAFLQSKIDEYNGNSNTHFILSNSDYDLIEIKNTYLFGATFTLLLSIAFGLALLFIRQEFFPPKLKL